MSFCVPEHSLALTVSEMIVIVLCLSTDKDLVLESLKTSHCSSKLECNLSDVLISANLATVLQDSFFFLRMKNLFYFLLFFPYSFSDFFLFFVFSLLQVHPVHQL